MTPPQSDIRLKRVYEPPAPDDGARVLVDRLWPRGVSKARAALTLWLKDIAPSAELRQWFGHDPVRWPEFARRYQAELAANPAAVSQLAKLIEGARVTLVYGARDTAHNEAVVLAQHLRERGSRS